MQPGSPIPITPAAVTSQDVAQILIWSGVLMGLVIVLAIVMVIARRRSGSQPAQSAPFTLGELRKLRDQGQLTDEEYQRTRDRLVGMARSDAGGEPGASAASSGAAPATGSPPEAGPATDPDESEGDDRADKGENGNRDGDGPRA